MEKYILFDTETTGLDDIDRIIQVGAMVLNSKYEVEEVIDELCNTNVPIQIEAMEIHGITPELIKGKLSFLDSIFYKRLNTLNNQKNYLIAHNMPFDMGMIKKEGFKPNLKIIDTLRCARHLFKESPHNRLQYYRYAMGLYKIEDQEAQKYNIVIKAHDAIGDVLVMKLFLSKLVEKVENMFPAVNAMEKLEELTKTPVFIEKFKFGKHRGEKIADVAVRDRGYLNWMLGNMDLDEDMKYTLDKVMDDK